MGWSFSETKEEGTGFILTEFTLIAVLFRDTAFLMLPTAEIQRVRNRLYGLSSLLLQAVSLLAWERRRLHGKSAQPFSPALLRLGWEASLLSPLPLPQSSHSPHIVPRAQVQSVGSTGASPEELPFLQFLMAANKGDGDSGEF